MKKILSLLGSAALVIGFATPAANATNYSVVQKTLSSFSSAATSLTSAQRAEVRRVVDKIYGIAEDADDQQGLNTLLNIWVELKKPK